MNNNLSLAVMALLGMVSVDALSMTQRARLDLDTDIEEASQALTEETRYVDSQGNFVNLAQTNHARLVLSQIKKDPVPVDQTYIMTEECFNNLAESSITKDSQGRLVDVITHCPVNEDGKPHEVSIK